MVEAWVGWDLILPFKYATLSRVFYKPPEKTNTFLLSLCRVSWKTSENRTNLLSRTFSLTFVHIINFLSRVFYKPPGKTNTFLVLLLCRVSCKTPENRTNLFLRIYKLYVGRAIFMTPKIKIKTLITLTCDCLIINFGRGLYRPPKNTSITFVKLTPLSRSLYWAPGKEVDFIIYLWELLASCLCRITPMTPEISSCNPYSEININKCCLGRVNFTTPAINLTWSGRINSLIPKLGEYLIKIKANINAMNMFWFGRINYLVPQPNEYSKSGNIFVKFAEIVNAQPRNLTSADYRRFTADLAYS